MSQESKGKCSGKSEGNNLGRNRINDYHKEADWEEEKYIQLMLNMDTRWFPKEWLAYVMVGKPGLWMVLSTLTSGGLALSYTSKEELNAKIRAFMNTTGRRANDQVKLESRSIYDTGGKEKIKLTASPKVYRHEFFLQKTADAEEDTYLILNKLLDEEITILEKIEKNEYW